MFKVAMRLAGNDFNRSELAGAFRDLGTLVPFVVGYITISQENRAVASARAQNPQPEVPCSMRTIGGSASTALSKPRPSRRDDTPDPGGPSSSLLYLPAPRDRRQTDERR